MLNEGVEVVPQRCKAPESTARTRSTSAIRFCHVGKGSLSITALHSGKDSCSILQRSFSSSVPQTKRKLQRRLLWTLLRKARAVAAGSCLLIQLELKQTITRREEASSFRERMLSMRLFSGSSIRRRSPGWFAGAICR